jgi:hypothetical protein
MIGFPFGSLDAIDIKFGPDQATQTAVVYCTIALIGTNKFLDFAQEINFYDEISHRTKHRG